MEEHLERLIVPGDNADFAARAAVNLGVHHHNRVVRIGQILPVEVTDLSLVLFTDLHKSLHAEGPEGRVKIAVPCIGIGLGLGPRAVRAHAALVRADTDCVDLHGIRVLVPGRSRHHVLCHALGFGEEEFLLFLRKSISKKGKEQRVLVFQLFPSVDQTRRLVQNCLFSLIHSCLLSVDEIRMKKCRVFPCTFLCLAKVLSA